MIVTKTAVTISELVCNTVLSLRQLQPRLRRDPRRERGRSAAGTLLRRRRAVQRHRRQQTVDQVQERRQGHDRRRIHRRIQLAWVQKQFDFDPEVVSTCLVIWADGSGWIQQEHAMFIQIVDAACIAGQLLNSARAVNSGSHIAAGILKLARYSSNLFSPPYA